MSLNKPVWKLRNWIDLEKLDWHSLSFNPNAIEILKKNEDKIDWYYLFKNCFKHLYNSSASCFVTVFSLSEFGP